MRALAQIGKMSRSGIVDSVATCALLTTLQKKIPSMKSVGARVGLSVEALSETTSTVPLVSFVAMFEAAANESGNATLGLELGKIVPASVMGPLYDLVRSSCTLGEGLEQYVSLFPNLQTGTKKALAVSNGTARLSYSIADPTIRFRAQDAGLTIGMEHSMLSDLLGPDWKSCGVDFEHAGPDDLTSHHRQISCPLRFGQRDNAIMFPARLLDICLPSADLTRHDEIKRDLSTSILSSKSALDLTETIEAWIAATIWRSNDITIGAAANSLGTSTRSLQRWLALHNLSFFDLCNRVRMQIAKCSLSETDASVTSIALDCGYSEASAFCRSFKASTGETPAGFRRRQRGIQTAKS